MADVLDGGWGVCEAGRGFSLEDEGHCCLSDERPRIKIGMEDPGISGCLKGGKALEAAVTLCRLVGNRSRGVY